MLKKIIRFIKNPRPKLIGYINNCAHLFKSDKHYLQLKYRLVMGERLDLKHPRSFNEKINWLKLYDHNPLYTILVDKYAVKDWVKKSIGEEYIIPTLAVWNRVEDIDIDNLPNQFVLKTNHGAGNSGVVICRDKGGFNLEEAKLKLAESLNTDTYGVTREWPYKNIKRKIIAEKYVEDSKTKELRDYKFFCFDGNVKAMFVATERQTRPEPYFNFFDENYNALPIKQGHPNSPINPVRPECFEQMKELASKLSAGIPQVRVDLYEVDGKVYFGEMTFYHFGGMVPIEPLEWDYKFGSWINLPTKKSSCKDA